MSLDSSSSVWRQKQAVVSSRTGRQLGVYKGPRGTHSPCSARWWPLHGARAEGLWGTARGGPPSPGWFWIGLGFFCWWVFVFVFFQACELAQNLGFWDFCSSKIFRRASWTLYHVLVQGSVLNSFNKYKIVKEELQKLGEREVFVVLSRFCQAALTWGLQLPQQCLSSSSFFVLTYFATLHFCLIFITLIHAFFMFCFFQLITHRLSGQEWTWCFHVLSCLSFPPWVTLLITLCEWTKVKMSISVVAVFRPAVFFSELSGGLQEVTLHVHFVKQSQLIPQVRCFVLNPVIEQPCMKWP